MGTEPICYLQQLPPSQQAGVPQQVWVTAARADNESKRVAANANTSALSFMMISFDDAVQDRSAAPRACDALPDAEEGDDLDAKIVFEIEDGGSVTETWSEFALRSNARSRLGTDRILSLRKRIRPLLFAGLFFRNRDSDVTGRAGFTGIVRG